MYTWQGTHGMGLSTPGAVYARTLNKYAGKHTACLLVCCQSYVCMMCKVPSVSELLPYRTLHDSI